MQLTLLSAYLLMTCKNDSLLIAAWNGVIFVRQGLYQDGVFRFSIEFAANFPDSDCPVNFFSWKFVTFFCIWRQWIFHCIGLCNLLYNPLIELLLSLSVLLTRLSLVRCVFIFFYTVLLTLLMLMLFTPFLLQNFTYITKIYRDTNMKNFINFS